MSRFLQGLFALRDLFHRAQPAAPAIAGPASRTVSLEAVVPAHRVAAVTEELNMRVQRILERVAAESAADPSHSTLLMVGVRVDLPGARPARVLH